MIRVRQDNGQAAENSCPPPACVQKAIMKVIYRVRPRDMLQGHLHLFNTSMMGKIGYSLWLLLPVVMGCLPLLRVINPIAHPLAVLRHIDQGVVFGWLVGSSALYIIAAVSKMVTSVSITSRGFTMVTGSIGGGSKRVVLWQQIKAVEEDAHYIYLHKFWHVLSLPKAACARQDNRQAAENCSPPPAFAAEAFSGDNHL